MSENAKWLTDRELVALSLELLRHLDGLQVSQALRVIEETKNRLFDVTHLSCNAKRFLEVVEELPLFSGEAL